MITSFMFVLLPCSFFCIEAMCLWMYCRKLLKVLDEKLFLGRISKQMLKLINISFNWPYAKKKFYMAKSSPEKRKIVAFELGKIKFCLKDTRNQHQSLSPHSVVCKLSLWTVQKIPCQGTMSNSGKDLWSSCQEGCRVYWQRKLDYHELTCNILYKCFWFVFKTFKILFTLFYFRPLNLIGPDCSSELTIVTENSEFGHPIKPICAS